MSSQIQRRRDEGPSPEDIERFSNDVGHCPDCGAEIWDQADICPKCYAYLAGHTTSRTPMESLFRRKWVVLIAIAVIAGFVIMFSRGGGALLRILFPGTP